MDPDEANVAHCIVCSDGRLQLTCSRCHEPEYSRSAPLTGREKQWRRELVTKFKHRHGSCSEVPAKEGGNDDGGEDLAEEEAIEEEAGAEAGEEEAQSEVIEGVDDAYDEMDQDNFDDEELVEPMAAEEEEEEAVVAAHVSNRQPGRSDTPEAVFNQSEMGATSDEVRATHPRLLLTCA